MIHISAQGHNLIVKVAAGEFAPRQESQLAFWGFSYEGDSNCFLAAPNNIPELIEKVTSYLDKCDLPFELDKTLKDILNERQRTSEAVSQSIDRGAKLKGGDIDPDFASEFLNFLKECIPRTLKDHQYKSALHLLAVENGANFSVPGSGKTTVVLSVFKMLRRKGIIDALFVVGPPACFGPWREEYEDVIGKPPEYAILAGGDIDVRHNEYLTNTASACDLYLTSFQTLLRDWDKVQVMFHQQGIRFYVVIDEAHYIKQIDGSWAKAALQVAPYAERRCVLTGTPFPKSYSDSFNLFDFLWPGSPPISSEDKHKIVSYMKRKEFTQSARVLNESIGPLFYRVRKSDLGLAPQIFHEPDMVRMNENESMVYDTILDRVKIASQQDYFRDLDLVLRLRRGRMMRLRQCLSYIKLLTTALESYDEDLIGEDATLAGVIHRYDELEKPGKIRALMKIVEKLRHHGEKVVIWSNFVETLKLIKRSVSESGHGVCLIYGATPLEKSYSASDDLSRERIIRDFVDEESGIDILVANPAACAESISLHKTCSNAIYYDLSYNCAQYLQSLDRIHRVGGSECKPSYYYFLQYERSLDQDILNNVRSKSKKMSDVIDQDYPIYSLDMFDSDDEDTAYLRLFEGCGPDIQ